MRATSQELPAEPVLRVISLSKTFHAGAAFLPWRRGEGIRAVEDVSFDLFPGKITALVGESGSGKSTVARLLARLYEPTAGMVLFRGDPVFAHHSARAVRRYRSEVQMIFQDPFGSLNPVKLVRHHLERPLRIHGIVPPDQVEGRIYELLTSVGLVPADEFAQKYPHQLSGGQRQRVAIARALAVEPMVLLADEPISMLDVSIRMGILNLMLELKSRRGLAFLYITHDIASARYVADDILVMYKGHVVEQGETDAVLHNPLHPYTQLLLSAVPNPEAGLRQQRLEGRTEGRIILDPTPGPGVPATIAPGMAELVEIEPNHWVRYSQPQQSSSDAA
jgi:peptide/nickel transport system ATP-binding protein